MAVPDLSLACRRPVISLTIPLCAEGQAGFQAKHSEQRRTRRKPLVPFPWRTLRLAVPNRQIGPARLIVAPMLRVRIPPLLRLTRLTTRVRLEDP